MGVHLMTLFTPNKVTIRAGTGIDVGNDFTRLEANTEMVVREEHKGKYYGTIAGIPTHPRSFMRTQTVSVCVPKQCTFIKPETPT
jgi:hypothetical protein